MIIFLLGGLGLYAIYYKMSGKQKEKRVLTDVERRSNDTSMLLDVYRGLGQVLTNTGNDDEAMKKYNQVMSQRSVKDAYVLKHDLTSALLTGQISGQTKILKRQQFQGPSEFTTPLTSSLSGWYEKAVHQRDPYVTRIIPASGLPN
jgi:hypothetical protein